MKRLELVGLKACGRCHWAVAYLMTEDGDTLGIILDAVKARELSRHHQGPGDEKYLTALLLKLLAGTSYVPRQVVLDCGEGGFPSARIDITTDILSCSLQEGVVFAVAAEIPLFAAEWVFEHRHLFHPPDMTGESTDLIQPKLKPTLH